MAKTIYTYLHNDDLNGSRVVNMDNCFCKLFKIQRTDGDFLQVFKEDLQKPALYILQNQEERKAYIGETDAFLTRIQQDINKAKNWKDLGEDHPHYFTTDKDILVSGDGVKFVVCVEWDKNNIINVLGIAQALGWKFEIVK